MATHLIEGKKAPSFTGTDQNGETISLPDFLGKKLVLFFYPEDDTPTCTIEACNLRDNYSVLQEHGLEVLGISPDEPHEHQKFKEKYSLPYSLLADPKRKIIDKYGVWGEKQMFGNKFMGLIRTTFIIDERGYIEKIFYKPRSAQHAEDILKHVKG